MAASPAVGFKNAWTPLRHGLFRAIWIAAMASNIGTWMHTMGASWLMTTLVSSPLMVALVQTATTLPVFLVGLPAGAMADLVDRRRMLLFTQSWMLLAAAALGALTLAGRTGPWTLLAVTFALGLGSAMNGPAWAAAIPELVPREEMPAAVVLNSVQFNIARAVGPALAGIVLAASSAGVLFVLNALSFLGVILVVWRWEPSSIERGRETVTAAMLSGLRYVHGSPTFHAVLIRSGMFVFAGSGLWALLPVVASRGLAVTAFGYGVLLGCLGAGAVTAAALLAPLRARYPADALVAAGNLLFAGATLGLALLGRVEWVAAAMLAGGIAWMTTMSTFNVTAQTPPPVWLRARALGVYLLVFQAALAGGSAAWGALAARIGVRGALLWSAAALLAGLAGGWRMRLAPAFESVDPDEVVADEESDRVY
jgi:MFS family permease